MKKTLGIILGLVITVTVLASKQEETCKALEDGNANTPPAQIDKLFTDFCNANFGAEQEELVYKVFGNKLKVLPKGAWVYPSEKSASIAWETNLPAKSYIEYGETDKYGKKSKTPKRYHYLHLHYMENLKPNTTYHYRTVVVDERGNKLVSKDMTIKTKTITGAIQIPGKLTGPPYVLDKPDTTYVLTKDLVCDGTAFEVKAAGITLDLGGHKVIYHNKTLDKKVFTDKWLSYVHKGVFGVKNIDGSKFTLLNGVILEGKGQNRGNNESTGFNPLYIRGCSDVTIAGVKVNYHTPQSVGIRFRNSGDNFLIHHCEIYDRGTKMQNRHGGGCASVNFLGKKGKNIIMHHNLVKRTRQNGLRGAEELYSNEIYVDSWATNSFATGTSKSSHNNRIFCTGYHAISCPWGDGIKIYDNFIHMQGINTGKTRWWEGFGDQNSMNGLRHTQWSNNKTKSKNSLYKNNTVVIKGRNGSQIRGVEFFSDPYIKNLTLENCTIKVIAQDKKTKKATCVVTHGLPKRKDSQLPVFYKNCTFMSNINIIRLGDDYGVGCNHQFYNCKFIKLGKNPRFKTIRASGVWSSLNHIFRDCVCKNGASLEDVDWGKTMPGTRDYYVQHTLIIKDKKGSKVVITDATGKKVFDGAVPANGKLEMGLNEYYMSHAGKKVLTPHVIEINGKKKTITMNKKQTL